MSRAQRGFIFARFRKRALRAVLLSWLLIATTFTRRAQAFRTAGDQQQFAGTDRVRWANGNVSYEINSALPPGLTQPEVDEVAKRALASWSSQPCGQITFALSQHSSVAAAPGDGVNTIQFVTQGWRTRGYDPSAAGITDVQYLKEDSGWTIVEADIYINADNFSWIPSGVPVDGSRDLDSVLTHESGHVLGLLHPCEVGGAYGAPDCASNPSYAATTMYPIYNPHQAMLSKDDIAGLCFLYPGSSCALTGCPAGNACTAGGCLPACGNAICQANERCTPDGCWPTDKCWGPECVEPACERDTDCGGGGHCIGQRCVGGGAEGDPCTTGADCGRGVCGPAGFCDSSCGNCPGGTCSADGGHGSQCSSGKLPIGSACSSPDECIGGQCLAGADQTPVCTRLCGADQPSCPPSWECEVVEQKNVCRPMRFEPAGGCSVSTHRPGSHAAWLWLAGLGAFIASFRRRRSLHRFSPPPPGSDGYPRGRGGTR